MNVFVMVVSIGVWAAMAVWWFWDYIHAVTHRQPGESLSQAIKRASQERALNRQAKDAMFGKPLVTSLVTIASTVLTLLVLIWLLQGRFIGLLLAVYLGVGLVLNRRLEVAKHKSWARLGSVDRLRFRITHAWLWPLHRMGRGAARDSSNES